MFEKNVINMPRKSKKSKSIDIDEAIFDEDELRDIEDFEQEQKSYRARYNVVIPEDVARLIDYKRRRILRYAIRKLEIILKFAVYHLRGFDYSVRIRWEGVNPTLVVKINLIED